MSGVGITAIWDRFSLWYKVKLGSEPNPRTIVTIKRHNIEARYNILISAIFMRVTKKDDTDFEKYLDYVYREWVLSKKDINMFARWLGSPIMMKNFTDTAKIIIRRESDTYSNHAAVGRGEDGEFDPTGMFR